MLKDLYIVYSVGCIAVLTISIRCCCGPRRRWLPARLWSVSPVWDTPGTARPPVDMFRPPSFLLLTATRHTRNTNNILTLDRSSHVEFQY